MHGIIFNHIKEYQYGVMDLWMVITPIDVCLPCRVFSLPPCLVIAKYQPFKTSILTVSLFEIQPKNMAKFLFSDYDCAIKR